jgi:hypothetical protein
MILRVSTSLLLLSLVACTTTSTIPMGHVTGTWYGSSHQPSNSRFRIHWVIDRSSDGTFALATYEEKPCGLAPFTQESGRWSMSNGIYTALTTHVDGEATDASDKYYQDVYEVIGSSPDRLTYRSITYDIEFEARRVKSGYRPPLTTCPSGGAARGEE